MLIYKGKGILVPIFLIVSIIGCALLSGVLKRNIESLKDIEISFNYILVIGFWVAGIWTRFAKDTYIIKDGKKIILTEEINSFYFIKMNYWSDIFFIIGTCFILEIWLF